MEQNMVTIQIDEHLLAIQRDTTSALDRLERSGFKVDKEFLDYFLKLSFDRLTQTCDRYTVEAKYKMSCTMAAAMTSTLGAENTSFPSSATEKTDDLLEKGDILMKRKADTMNASSEVSKKQKTSEATVNNDQSDGMNLNGKNSNGAPNHPVSPIGTPSTAFNDNVNQLVEGQMHKPQNEQAKTQIELNANQVEKDASDRLNEPERHNATNSTNEPSLTKELFKQQKLANSVYVKGIYHNLAITDRSEVFLELCKKMGMTILPSSIQTIKQKTVGMVVRLHCTEMRNSILEQSRDKFVWSNELFELSDGKKPWKIHIYEDMTNYYVKMWSTAVNLKDQHHLHSFRLSEDGLVAQRTPNCKEYVVLSEKQLLDYIQNN